MAIFNVRDYKIKFTDQFFFDANVWLLLFGTIANFQKNDQREYSIFLKEIIIRERPIFITSMIVSEFINVLLRHDFKQYVEVNNLINQKYKENFVGSSTYKNSVETITNSVNSIFKIPTITLISDDFSSINHTSILDNLKFIDYNDSYINQLSLKNAYKIVTNDKDFQKINSKIDIITTQI